MKKKNERQNIQEAICLAGWFATANEIYDLKKFSFFFFSKINQSGSAWLSVWLESNYIHKVLLGHTKEGRLDGVGFLCWNLVCSLLLSIVAVSLYIPCHLLPIMAFFFLL